jgi:hypothetical protein
MIPQLGSAYMRCPESQLLSGISPMQQPFTLTWSSTSLQAMDYGVTYQLVLLWSRRHHLQIIFYSLT